MEKINLGKIVELARDVDSNIKALNEVIQWPFDSLNIRDLEELYDQAKDLKNNVIQLLRALENELDTIFLQSE